MRLLKIQDDGFTLIECFSDDIPPYTILSHTWGPLDEEVTYQDLLNDAGKKKEGYRELVCCATQTKLDGLEYFWVDTCCINKTSSAELSEAINSMYIWYQAAEVCYAYLVDVPSKNSFLGSRWFIRGWTLQELVAPAKVVFFDEHWESIGTKADLCKSVSAYTRIPSEMLSDEKELETFSVAQRMSWAAERKTTRIEDRAYSLMGIFDINLSLIYGEGENSFIRLQEEIMKISDGNSLFAWQSTDSRGGCLATSPAAFSLSSQIIQRNVGLASYEPAIVSDKGIHLDLYFMGGNFQRHGIAILNCCEEGKEDDFIGIWVKNLTLSMGRFERVWSFKLAQFDPQGLRPSRYPMRRLCIGKGRIMRNRRFQVTPTPSHLLTQPSHISSLVSFLGNEQTLHQAISKGNVDTVWMLLTDGDTEVNALDLENQIPLSLAAAIGNEKAVSMLLSHNDVDINHKNMSKRTPLSLAAGKGHESIVKLLLDTGKAMINARDIFGRTPMSWAAATGNVAVSKLLLKTNKVSIDWRDGIGETPLSLAAFGGHEKIMMLILTRHDVQNVDAQGPRSTTAFWWSAKNGLQEAVQLLLATDKVDVDVKGDKQMTPLLNAAMEGHDLIFTWLVETGKADLNAKDKNGCTSLHYIAKHGHEKMFNELLQTGIGKVDVNLKDDEGRAPLALAAEYGRLELVKRLARIERVELNSLDGEMRTPLSWASENGHEEVVRHLLLACDVRRKTRPTRWKNTNGKTPLSLATEKGYEEIVRLFRSVSIS